MYKMLKRFLTSVLAALLLVQNIGCVSVDISNDNDYLLPVSVKPLAYDLSLMLSADQTRFNGRVEIRVSALTQTDTITLHCDELDITNSTFSRIDEERSVKIPTAPVRYDKGAQRCAFTLADTLAPRTNYTLALVFKGAYDNEIGITKGFFTTADGTKKWITQTDFQPTYARRVFPCFDEPAYKARFTLRLGRSQNMTAVSNMPLKSSTVDMDNGVVWDEFEETPPMSTYLLAFTVFSDYVKVTDPKTNLSIWLPEEWQQYSKIPLLTASEVITFLQDYTGVAYALPKLDNVFVTKLNEAAMENWGIITYANHYFTCDDETCPSEDIETMLMFVTHEIAHQWFGNLVTLKWWSYVWLNEGFASYFHNYILSVIKPEWRTMETFCVYYIQMALQLDVKRSTYPLTSFSVKTREEIGSMFSYLSYMKGATIVYMLQNILSEETFKRTISEYLKKHTYESVTEDDLWESVRNTVGNNNRDIAEVMHSWTHETGFPLITVKRENNSIILTQEKYLGKHNETGVRWWIPLTYTTSSDVNFNNIKLEWFPPDANIFVLDQPVYNNEWIMFNTGFVGYYRINYDTITWKLLMEYLRQCNSNEVVPPVSKSQILDDVFTLAASGHVDYKTALDMASILQCEMDFIPWYSGIRAFTTLAEKLYITEAYSLFKSYMLELAADAYNEHWYKTVKSATQKKITQNIIVPWVCELGHNHCQSTAVELMNQIMSGANVSIPIDLMETVMCTGVRSGGEEVWSYVRKLYIEANNTHYRKFTINAMGCSLHRDIIQRLLTDVYSKADFIREDDAVSITDAVVSNQYNTPVVIDYFLQKFTSVYDVLGDEMVNFLSILSAEPTTAEDAEKLKKIVSLLPTNKTSAADIAEIFDNIKENEEWMSHHYNTVFNWLKDHQISTDTPRASGKKSTHEGRESDLDNVTVTDSSQESGLNVERIPEVITNLPYTTTVKPNSTTTITVHSFILLLALIFIVISAY